MNTVCCCGHDAATHRYAGQGPCTQCKCERYHQLCARRLPIMGLLITVGSAIFVGRQLWLVFR